MFRIAKISKCMWPVTVYVPADGGDYTKRKFTAEFKVLPRPEIDKLMRNESESEGGDWLTGVWLGWNEGEVQDDEGRPLVPSEESIKQMLDIPYVRSAVYTAYLEMIAGGGKRKN